MKPPSKKLRASYIADPILFNRVGKFLDDNIDKPVIDKEAMVDALRDTYMEYKRKSRSSFRACVFKAYDLITQVLTESADTTINLSADDDVEDEDVTMDMDETMNSGELTPPRGSPVMYIQSVKSMANANAARNNTSELINISSDEECQPEEETSVKQPVSKPELHARALIGRNSAITISTVNPKSPNKKKLLGKRKFISSIDVSRKHSVTVSIPKVTFKDFGGNSKVIEAVSGLLMHLNYYYIYTKIGVPPPRGFLLHGPPGCGKTLLARAIAGELGIPLLKTAGPELVGGLAGESEQRIRDLFVQAKEASPCIIFIDEIDVIFPPRESARKEMERRIVAQILSSFDDLNDSNEGEGIAVIGATTNPGSLDPALRRAGRFDREICLGIPDKSDRKLILEVLCRNMKISKNVSLEKVADLTPGYVGADLNALFSQAGIAAVTRLLKENQKIVKEDIEESNGTKEESDKNKCENKDENETGISSKDSNGQDNNGIELNPVVELNSASTLLKRVFELKSGDIDNLEIEMVDILNALKLVQPSSKREGFATVPDVSWNDIGSLKEIREKLDVSIMIPVKYPKLFEKVGIRAPSGILLYGPPGCGKTLVAKAVANEANINFISVKGPELLNMYVGESERAVRQCFQRARNSQPCVIFFDEIDALCPRRSDSKEGSFSSRIVNQVLTEMDGVEDRQGVFLMAATNRPDMVDSAVLRPGRLDKLVYVGLPNADDRVDILRALTKNGTKPHLSNDVSLEDIGKNEKCSRYSGADLAALIREASIMALNDYVKENESVDAENFDVCVTASHFQNAFDEIKPSVSEKEREHYERFHSLYGTIKDK